MTAILIGITGNLGSGKSTLAAVLAERIPGAVVVGFADRLKARVHQIVEGTAGIVITPTDLEAHKGDVFGPLYQGWGQLIREFVDEDYWVRALEAALPERAIVADVRHQNEAKWIKARGGLLVAVDGPCRRESDQRNAQHPSEAGVADCRRLADLSVGNFGTVDLLRKEAVHIARIATTLAESGETLCASS
jgi:hypothetical protein